MSNYTVKYIKNFRGREGYGFNATLYRDGNKIAFVSDMADGGPVRFDWEDYKSGEDAAFEAFAKTQPPEVFSGMTIPCNGDIYVNRLVDNYAIEKQLKAGLKKKTYFVANDGNIYVNKMPYSQALAQQLASKYPGAVFLNTLPFDEAFRLYAGR